jgi:protein involved in polysaccharide export with SLBB domain
MLLAGLLSSGCSTQKPKQHFADLPPEGGQAQPAHTSESGSTSVGGSSSAGSGGSAESTPTPVTPTGSGTVENHATPAKSASSGAVTNLSRPKDYSQYRLRVGDSLAITFTDTPVLIPASEARINDDGKITLMQNHTFDAAGKTCSMLANEIRDAYVPNYFVNMTVNVMHLGQSQFFYVRGEVKAPGRLIYTGPITVTQAIAACGDFTDFAKKTNVELIRIDGRKQKLDCLKAVKEPKLDPEVFPGDTIVVHRKIF